MDLKELRREMAKLLKAAQDLEYHQFIGGKVVEIPANNPAVIVWHGNKLSSCWRKQKPDGAVEVVAITKSDRSDGPTARKMDHYMAKVAGFMERHGQYSNRKCITDKTDLFKGLDYKIFLKEKP